MGNSIPLDCSCVVSGFSALAGDDRASRDRLESLQKGQKFLRKALLGLTTQEVAMKLSEDTSCVEWRIDATRITKEEYGVIDLTSVKCIKLSGPQGMQYISNEKDKVLFEVTAEDAQVRDRWALALNDLLQKWESDPESKPTHVATAAETSKKAAYFKKREEELADKIKANEEKKKKYSAGGMQYTALAMMNRS